MTLKRKLFYRAGLLSPALLIFLGIVFTTQSLSCDDGWRPESCDQENGPYPDYTQDRTHIKVGEIVTYTYSGPEYENYKLFWDMEGGQNLTLLGGSRVVNIRYGTAGVYKGTVELRPTKCKDFDIHYKTYNPTVWVEK